MTSPPADSPPVVTEETVRTLAELVGVHVEPDDVPTIAARLGELFAAVGDLDELDWAGAEPELAFDPTWREDE